MPAAIVDKLAAEIIMSDSEFQKLLINDGAIPQLSPPPAELKKFVESEIVRWGEVVTRAGIAGSR